MRSCHGTNLNILDLRIYRKFPVNIVAFLSFVRSTVADPKMQTAVRTCKLIDNPLNIKLYTQSISERIALKLD